MFMQICPALMDWLGFLVLFAVLYRLGNLALYVMTLLVGTVILVALLRHQPRPHAMGLYTGSAYFAAVYYASNSGRRSLNIGVNECLVGMGSFAGLFAVHWGEALMGTDRGMYAVCAIGLLVSLLIQVTLASTRPI